MKDEQEKNGNNIVQNNEVVIEDNKIDDKKGSLKLYERTWFMFLTLIFITPVGIFLVWKYGKFNKITKLVISFVFAGLFIYNIMPSSNYNIDVSKYFPNKPMVKVYYTYEDGVQIFGANEEIIEQGTKENVLNWVKYLYINDGRGFSSLGNTKGVYEISRDNIISIETSGGFNTGKEVIELSNSANWSAHKEDKDRVKSYISGDFYRITVEAGVFENCLEVITETKFEGNIVITRDYYAPYIGKVLSEIKTPEYKDFIKFTELVEYRN